MINPSHPNTSDIAQLSDHGIKIDVFNRQLAQFRTGFAAANLDRIAKVNDGINRLTTEEMSRCATRYNQKVDVDVLKFVPASGAATRMFKHLFSFLSDGQDSEAIDQFFGRLSDFAFSKDVVLTESRKSFLHQLLNVERMGDLAKGLIMFHTEKDGAHTAFEEHFHEGYAYGYVNNEVHIHFTVGHEHLAQFESLAAQIKEKFIDVDFNVSYSLQKKSTDTIAVDLQNEPFRNDDGQLVLRPAGHGALLENFNSVDADLIFLKNIDNVVAPSNMDSTTQWKKILGGCVLELVDIRNEILNAVSNGKTIDENLRTAFKNYTHQQLPDNVVEIQTLLDRPFRVCGMVKNEGEPGGGPFWVRDEQGQTTLQIVEKAQIDESLTDQKEILLQSTHFNPVDVVCWVRDRAGNKYDLLKYRDDKAGFISEKSVNGSTIKAMELPGLWNGAMANWLTVFVEVPLETFNPVKSVNDLLRPAHQPS